MDASLPALDERKSSNKLFTNSKKYIEELHDYIQSRNSLIDILYSKISSLEYELEITREHLVNTNSELEQIYISKPFSCAYCDQENWIQLVDEPREDSDPFDRMMARLTELEDFILGDSKIQGKVVDETIRSDPGVGIQISEVDRIPEKDESDGNSRDG